MKNNYSTLSNTYISNINAVNQNYTDPPPPGYAYRPVASASGHDCTNVADRKYCANVGKGICSLTPCSDIEITNGICYARKDFCELENRCDEEGGWTWNTDHTDCNIYKCTTDGSIASDPSKNNNDKFTYVPPKEVKAGRTLYGSCYRNKFITDTNHDSCYNDKFICYHDSNSAATKSMLDKWYKQGWDYKDCTGWPNCNPLLENESNIISTSDNPIKYFNPSQYELSNDENCPTIVTWEAPNVKSGFTTWDHGGAYPVPPITGECIDTTYYCSSADSGYTAGKGDCVDDPRVTLNCPKTCKTCT